MSTRILGLNLLVTRRRRPWWPTDERFCPSVVASQIDIHRKYGGVVPELARASIAQIVPVVREALEQAGMKLADVTRWA